MTDAILRGIRRRLTVLVVLVAAIAIVDGLYFRAHPATDYHECRLD